MSETVAEQMPGDSQIEANQWLTEAELAVYSTAYGRTGFQGGLNSYRCGTDARWNADLQVFSGRRIDVPACFIGGAQDWGVYQSPGHLERMRDDACSDLRGVYLIEGAGHWVQQEQPDSVGQRLVEFLAS